MVRRYRTITLRVVAIAFSLLAMSLGVETLHRPGELSSTMANGQSADGIWHVRADDDDFDDDDDDREIPDRVTVVDGRGRVTLTPYERDLAALEIKPLENVAVSGGSIAFGQALDPRLIIEHRLAIKTRAESIAARVAELNAASARLKRLRELTARGNLNVAAERVKLDQSVLEYRRLLAHDRAELRRLQDTAGLRWGHVLGGAVVNGTPLVEELASGSATIVRASPTVSGEFPQPGKTVRLLGDSLNVRADVLDRAPTVEPSSDRPGYLLLVRGNPLPGGLRVDVVADSQNDAASRLALPPSAVVWHAGRPWYYAVVSENV